MICKCAINPFTNPNPIYSHLSCDSTFVESVAFFIYQLTMWSGGLLKKPTVAQLSRNSPTEADESVQCLKIH
jgi:hypothetical protein